ncbi:unnamed protein product [Bursaphelenchus okinawaensis]|uniref:Serine/threonine-protein phosphatase n=1 Tax=Bursaphelenchus okinawaensis TaxID=465554 RepID=A0A811KAX8_9BILA|nr:unnamed protein product [Bursaphelenchus okinawaensis]CAG9095829.1 unnamed protein product [Bursaphelenchus okinawaensis]
MTEAVVLGSDPLNWLEQVKKCRYLPETEMNKLCRMLRNRMVNMPSVVRVSSPVTVCGDIHGQFYDLLRLFQLGGEPSDIKYVFLGDYVDRGHYSVETVTLLFLYFLCYPDNVTLIRGNHETRRISVQYGFYEECQEKYGHSAVWLNCCRVFDMLPIAALIDDSYFCVHGGISPSLPTIDHILALQRDVEVPLSGILSDILWSDPDDTIGTFAPNQRGAGFLFGEQAVDKFLDDNKVNMIVRSHQLVMEGFKYMFNEKLATVWSAPNYCYRCGNMASMFNISGVCDPVPRKFDCAPNWQRKIPDRMVTPYFL